MIFPRAVLLVLLGALTACGSSAPLAPRPPPKTSATIDGLYRGTSTRSKAEDKSCPRPGLVRFQVVDRSFRYRLNGPITVDATINPDGTVTGEAAGFTLQGEWDGQKLEGEVVSIICVLHFRAVKQN